jgi:predicted phosphodiesterase
MRLLIFSDIHGNLPAFERMIKSEPGVDMYISLGDVVNYGPWSNECVDLLESLKAIKIRGNHEEYFIKGSYTGKHELVKTFFEVCYSTFVKWKEIETYIDHYCYGTFSFQHTINESYIFPDSVIDTNGNYFIGHSHHQFDRHTENWRVVNVGSVGQNRKNISIINFALYDFESGIVDLRSVHYEVNLLIDKMKSMNYPTECINYYLSKLKR